MRFKGRLELEHGLKRLDITPIINIIFLLLIFFMFVSGFLIQPGIKVNLPRAVTSEVLQYENIEILLGADNAVYLNGKAVTGIQLQALFKQIAKRNQAIFIKADRRASLGKVVEIWDMARDIGVTAINIATNPG